MILHRAQPTLNVARNPQRRCARWLPAAVTVLSIALVSATSTVTELSRRADDTHGVSPIWASSWRVPFLSAHARGVSAPDSTEPVVRTVSIGGRVRVPILMYHYVRVTGSGPANLLGFNLSVSPQLFAAQMALLHVAGATPITLSTLMDALAGEGALPPRPVVLTFDDGYADFATVAEPILKQYGFVATDYVVSGFLGRPGYMSAAQVQQMDAAGMVIGSHTMHHVDLSHLTAAAARAEIEGGKAALEALLGHPVLDFAYPYGRFNAATEAIVQQAGFREAVTTIAGDLQVFAARFALPRDHIGGAPSLAEFSRLAHLT
jgi:peptidoglycan/xylan/chitin deacetylase (PgdA/CDA1 family)